MIWSIMSFTSSSLVHRCGFLEQPVAQRSCCTGSWPRGTWWFQRMDHRRKSFRIFSNSLFRKFESFLRESTISSSVASALNYSLSIPSTRSWSVVELSTASIDVASGAVLTSVPSVEDLEDFAGLAFDPSVVFSLKKSLKWDINFPAYPGNPIRKNEQPWFPAVVQARRGPLPVGSIYPCPWQKQTRGRCWKVSFFFLNEFFLNDKTWLTQNFIPHFST